MARGLGTLTVWLSADTRNFTKGMTSAKRTMAKFSNAATVAAAAAGAAIVAFGVQSVRAFMVQEKATNNLSNALEALGNQSSATLPLLRKYAQEMQKNTIHSDDFVESTMAYGLNLGINTKQIKEATTAAAGLAAKYNMDLSTAMMLLGRASQGQTQMLTRYGIVLDENATKEEKFNQLLKIGAAHSVLAEKKTETLSGKLKQMGNAWGDVKESIGEVISESLQFPELMDWITDKFAAVSQYIQDNLHEIIYIVQSMVVEISSALNQTWTLGVNVVNGIVSIIGTAGQNIFNIGEWVFDNIVKYFTNLPSIVIGITTDIYNLIKNVLTTYLELFYNFGEAVWSVLTGGGISGALDDMLKNASQNMVNAIADIGKETGKAMVKAGFTELKIEEPDYAGTFGRIFDDIGDIEAAKTAKLEELLTQRMKKAGAISGVADIVKAEEGKASAKKAEKATSPLVSAIQKGSMEALRAEQGRTKTEDKIEANTRKTASGIDKMAEGMSKILGRVGIAGGLNLEAAI